MSIENRYEYIDSLRGWAILGVILVHVWIWIGAESQIISQFAQKGAYGVQLFYIISAFTLLLSIKRYQQQGKMDWRAYFIRRFFRIAPLFYIAMLVYGPFWQFVPRYWMSEGIQAWHILTSLTFLHGWHPKSVNSIVPGGWSMSVEMTFYMIFPLLFFMINTVQRAVLFTIAAFLIGFFISQFAYQFYLPVVPEYFSYVVKNFAYIYMPTAQICVFGLGFVLFYGLLHKEDQVWSNKFSKTKISGLILTMFGLCLIVCLIYFLPAKFAHFFSFSIAFIFILAGLSIYPIQLFVNPLMSYMGTLSYSLYLIHFGVIFLFKSFSGGFFAQFNQDFSLLIVFISVLSITTILSMVSYRFIEQPGIAIGKKLILRYQFNTGASN